MTGAVGAPSDCGREDSRRAGSRCPTSGDLPLPGVSSRRRTPRGRALPIQYQLQFGRATEQREREASKFLSAANDRAVERIGGVHMSWTSGEGPTRAKRWHPGSRRPPMASGTHHHRSPLRPVVQGDRAFDGAAQVVQPRSVKVQGVHPSLPPRTDATGTSRRTRPPTGTGEGSNIDTAHRPNNQRSVRPKCSPKYRAAPSGESRNPEGRRW